MLLFVCLVSWLSPVPLVLRTTPPLLPSPGQGWPVALLKECVQTGSPISPSCYLGTPGISRQSPQGLGTGAAASFTPSAPILFCAQRGPLGCRGGAVHRPGPQERAQSLQSCPTLCDPMNCSPSRLLCPWDSPGKNTGVGCHALLQGIFPTHGLNPSFLHLCTDRWVLYHLCQLGSPKPL